MTIAAKILTRCLAGPPADVESIAHVENANVGAVENVENANVEAMVEDAKTVVVASEGLPIVETVGEHDAD